MEPLRPSLRASLTSMTSHRGTNAARRATTATVVKLYGARHGYPAPSSLPRVGQQVLLRLRNGIIDDPRQTVEMMEEDVLATDVRGGSFLKKRGFL
jgi:hypothetical protein